MAAEEDDEEELVIGDYIERGPSELLRTIASGIGKDHTAPEYRYLQ